MMNTSTLPCSISLYRDGAGLTSEFTAEYSILAQERVYFYIANCDGDDAEVDVRGNARSLEGMDAEKLTSLLGFLPAVSFGAH